MPDKVKTGVESGSKKEPFLPRTAVSIVSVIGGLVTLITASFGLYKAWQTPQSFGDCVLKPQTPPNVKRLNGYMEEGQRYAAKHSYDLAAHRFQQVIDVDPNFLGAHQDLGVVQLAQGKFKDAQNAFDEEIKLIDCLHSVKSELYRFAYMLDQEGRNQQLANSVFHDRLNAAEDTAHYNLACVLVKQGENIAALDELNKAAEHHSIKRETVIDDPDLLPVRHEIGYEAALSHF